MVFKIFSFLFMTVFSGVFDGLSEFNIVSIPELPPEFYTYLDMGFDYMIEGFSLLGCFFAVEYMIILFGISLIIILVEHIYLFVMWVIRKLPIASE